MLSLREITKENYMECLRLKVSPDQENFVASNAVSIVQSVYHADTVPRAIYVEETMVGFVMYTIDPDDGNYWIWRLMIDKNHQSKGYASEAMRLVLADITRDKNHNKIILSFHPNNKVAEEFYRKLGFIHTGKIIEKEVVMQYNY